MENAQVLETIHAQLLNAMISLSDSLKSNSTLTELNLYQSSIGDSGARALSDSLKSNSTLTKLDLYENSIGDEPLANKIRESIAINLGLCSICTPSFLICVSRLGNVLESANAIGENVPPKRD